MEKFYKLARTMSSVVLWLTIAFAIIRLWAVIGFNYSSAMNILMRIPLWGMCICLIWLFATLTTLSEERSKVRVSSIITIVGASIALISFWIPFDNIAEWIGLSVASIGLFRLSRLYPVGAKVRIGAIVFMVPSILYFLDSSVFNGLVKPFYLFTQFDGEFELPGFIVPFGLLSLVFNVVMMVGLWIFLSDLSPKQQQ